MLLALALAPVSLLAQNSTNALPPLAPAYGEIRPTIWEQHGTEIVVAGVVFVALLGAASWMVFRPKAPAAVPPEVQARDILTRLAGRPEDGKILSEISQTVRHYVVAAFDLPPGESTTGEFTAAVAQNGKIGPGPAQIVSDFLRECDHRKFSPVNPAAPMNAGRRALEIVSELEKQRAKFAVKN
jgi:hypothetical protein